MDIVVTCEMGLSNLEHHIGVLSRLPGVQSIVVVRSKPGPTLPGVTYRTVPSLLRSSPGLRTAYKAVLLSVVARRARPEFLYCIGLFPHSLLTFVASRVSGRPWGVLLRTGPYELYGPTIPNDVSLDRPPGWYGRALLWILRQCDFVVAANTATRAYMVAHGIPSDRVWIMPRPVPPRFRRMTLPKVYDLIAVDRLSPEKQLDVLLQATRLVSQQLPGVRLAVVGEGPCRRALENIVSELGLSRNVEFLGCQPRLEWFYNSARVLVHTSAREAGPLCFPEAMACGIPAVVSEVGVVPDLGRNGENCLVVHDSRDYKAFAAAITRLLDDPKLYAHISIGALATAQATSMESATAEWEAIFKSLRRGQD